MPNPYAAEVGHQRRLAILAFLRAYWREHDRSPTVRDIGAAVGLSSPNSVHTHLRRLQEDGFITITPLLARRIELTAKGRRSA